MKTFRERFTDRIDATDGTVVLREGEYNVIQMEAYADGVKFGADKLLELIREKVAQGPIQLES